MKLLYFTVIALALTAVFSAFGAADEQVVNGDFGRSVVVETPFTRVVSLTPSITEDIYMLGAEESLVGVTLYCDYPPAAKEKPKMGDLVQPNIELVIAQKPDLVLSAGNAQQVLDKVSEFSIPCLSFRSESISDIQNDISRLGILLGKQEAARAILNDMTGVIGNIEERVRCLKPKTALLAFDLNPLIAGGDRTLCNEILTLAGFDNIALQAHSMYPTLSMEYIVAQRPEFFFYAGEGTESQTKELREKWAEWKSIPAVADSRIFSVSADLVSRSSPRIIQGLKDLNEILMREIEEEQPVKE